MTTVDPDFLRLTPIDVRLECLDGFVERLGRNLFGNANDVLCLQMNRYIFLRELER